jgi:hypothetical protein
MIWSRSTEQDEEAAKLFHTTLRKTRRGDDGAADNEIVSSMWYGNNYTYSKKRERGKSNQKRGERLWLHQSRIRRHL